MSIAAVILLAASSGPALGLNEPDIRAGTGAAYAEAAATVEILRAARVSLDLAEPGEDLVGHQIRRAPDVVRIDFY